MEGVVDPVLSLCNSGRRRTRHRAAAPRNPVRSEHEPVGLPGVALERSAMVRSHSAYAERRRFQFLGSLSARRISLDLTARLGSRQLRHQGSPQRRRRRLHRPQMMSSDRASRSTSEKSVQFGPDGPFPERKRHGLRGPSSRSPRSPRPPYYPSDSQLQVYDIYIIRRVLLASPTYSRK